MRRPGGFSLIEIAVATALLALLVLFVMALLPVGNQAMKEGRRQQDAVLLADTTMQTVACNLVQGRQSLPYSATTQVSVDGTSFSVQASGVAIDKGLYRLVVQVATADMKPIILSTDIFDPAGAYGTPQS